MNVNDFQNFIRRIDTPVGSFLLQRAEDLSDAGLPVFEIVDSDGAPMVLHHGDVSEAEQHAAYLDRILSQSSGLTKAPLEWEETPAGQLEAATPVARYAIVQSANVPQCPNLVDPQSGRPHRAIFSSKKRAIRALDQNQMMILRAIMMAA